MERYILYINGLAWHETYKDNIHDAITECIILGIYNIEFERLSRTLDIELCKFHCGSTVEYDPYYRHNS